MHIGQRDIAWIRISKEAKEKGFLLKHIGLIIHAKFHEMFGRIFDKVQVKIYTEEDKVKEITEKAKKVYAVRDARIEGMTDETTDIYYSCTFMPIVCSWACVCDKSGEDRTLRSI